MIRRPPRSTRTDTLFPYTTLFRSGFAGEFGIQTGHHFQQGRLAGAVGAQHADLGARQEAQPDIFQDLLAARIGLAEALHHIDVLIRRHYALRRYRSGKSWPSCTEPGAPVQSGEHSGGGPEAAPGSGRTPGNHGFSAARKSGVLGKSVAVRVDIGG